MTDLPFLPFRPPAWWASFENEVHPAPPAPPAPAPVLRDGPPPMTNADPNWWLR